ncbi:MAG: thiol reductant ABC exporter subunit CydC, partial [Bifidobacteriaceae bacterium]|nr:thiol reductant ABC exporter subunit CydC [Bifidobacteriaceae bacterium]
MTGATVPPVPPVPPPVPPMPASECRRRLLRLARPVLAPMAWSILSRIVGLISGIAMFAVAGWAVGAAASPSGVPPSFWVVIGVLATLSLVKGAARYAEQFAGHVVAFKALARIRVFFYDALAPQAPAAVEGRSTGDLLARVTKDVDRVEVFFAHTLAPAVSAVVVPAATVCFVAVAVSPWAALILAAGLGLAGLITPRIDRRGSEAAAAGLRAGRGTIAQHVTDSLQGVREVLAFDYAERRLAELAHLEAPVASGLTRLGRAVAARRATNVAIQGLTLVATFAVLAHVGVALPALTCGVAVALAAFAPVIAVEDFAADLGQAYASARRLFEVTDAPPLVRDEHATAVSSWDAGPLPARRRAVAKAPAVAFRDVTFTYPAGPDRAAQRTGPAVAGVTFEARPGRVTAIVGASGSGKSTLAALLTRSFDPDAGTVEVGGRDVRTMALDQVRAEVGVCPQRPYLFNDTIEANLRLARPDASPALLAEAIRAAGLTEVVDGEPDGLAARVGEMGERLSGGQRQRLAVARMVVRQPSVIVLDEATSQLDHATERRVLDAIWDRAGEATVIVIAHRLATVERADWIVVMDGGRVVEQGVWADLIRAGG